jgi:hypothetical protein
LGVADSSGPVLEITGVDGDVADGGVGALSLPKGAGSRMVERRRGGSCGIAVVAEYSGGGGAGRSSTGGE